MAAQQELNHSFLRFFFHLSFLLPSRLLKTLLDSLSFFLSSTASSCFWSMADVSSASLLHLGRGRGASELLLWQREGEQSVIELAKTGEGVSPSLSGPELKLGEQVCWEEETEGWKRREEVLRDGLVVNKTYLGFLMIFQPPRNILLLIKLKFPSLHLNRKTTDINKYTDHIK